MICPAIPTPYVETTMENEDATIEAWISAIGAEIAEVRNEAGYDQPALAEMVGLRPAGVSKIERGKTANLRTILRLLMALDADMLTFFTSVDYRVKAKLIKNTDDA